MSSKWRHSYRSLMNSMKNWRRQAHHQVVAWILVASLPNSINKCSTFGASLVFCCIHSHMLSWRSVIISSGASFKKCNQPKVPKHVLLFYKITYKLEVLTTSIKAKRHKEKCLWSILMYSFLIIHTYYLYFIVLWR